MCADQDPDSLMYSLSSSVALLPEEGISVYTWGILQYQKSERWL